jgi:hypothetical protein
MRIGDRPDLNPIFAYQTADRRLPSGEPLKISAIAPQQIWLVTNQQNKARALLLDAS